VGQVYLGLAESEVDGRTVTRNAIHAPRTGESGWGVTSGRAGGGRILGTARPHVVLCVLIFSPARIV